MKATKYSGDNRRVPPILPVEHEKHWGKQVSVQHRGYFQTLSKANSIQRGKKILPFPPQDSDWFKNLEPPLLKIIDILHWQHHLMVTHQFSFFTNFTHSKLDQPLETTSWLLITRIFESEPVSYSIQPSTVAANVQFKLILCICFRTEIQTNVQYQIIHSL